MRQMMMRGLLTFLCGATFLGFASSGSANDGSDAFKIGSKKVTVKSLYKDHQGKFYELEKQKYDLIEGLAKESYLDSFWEDLAKKKNVSVEAARNAFLDDQGKVSDAEIKESLERFKDHPKLKELPEKERRSQIVEYLKSMKTREAIDKILSDAVKSKKLVVLYPEPTEPRYAVTVQPDDHVKYGPNPEDVKPMGCSGNECAITVVEYSEYQCPFCVRVLPTIERLMKEYKGKVRWVVRDFPLGFHNRARPAAVAAHCAADQGKYWHMYHELFKNQRALADENLKAYGKNIGLDQKKYEKCLANPQAKMALIDKNYETGERLGVTGTPAFFINGRRLSGALPYEQFKVIFDEELANGKKS